MFEDLSLWREMERMRRDIDSFFSSTERPHVAASFPLMNVYDEGNSLVITAELPGMTREDVTISFADGLLTVSGKRTQPAAAKDMNSVRRERPEGEFSKSVRVPSKVDVDKISATLHNGVLTVTLPKSEEAKPKVISVA